MEKIEELRKRKIEEIKERRLWIINFFLIILTIILAFYIFFKVVEEENKKIIEFCKNKTGIYIFPNCTETPFCFGMEVTINCTKVNEEINRTNSI